MKTTNKIPGTKFPNKYAHSGITVSKKLVFYKLHVHQVTETNSWFVGLCWGNAHSGEAVVFGVSGVVLVYEYQRSKAPTWVSRFVQKARNDDLMNNLETKLGGLDLQKNMSEIVEKHQALCVFSSSMSLEQWRKALVV